MTKTLFSVIFAFVFFGIIFIAGAATHTKITAAIIIALAFEGAVAICLQLRLFISKGSFLESAQWISGIACVVALFDAVLRLTKRGDFLNDNFSSLITDGILIALFLLWLAVSRNDKIAMR